MGKLFDPWATYDLKYDSRAGEAADWWSVLVIYLTGGRKRVLMFIQTEQKRLKLHGVWLFIEMTHWNGKIHLFDDMIKW